MARKHRVTVFAVLVFLLSLTVSSLALAGTTSGTALTADEQALLNSINSERTSAGLSPLTINPELVAVARSKSKDMADNNYFSKVSPTYGTPEDMLRSAGIQYSRMAMNITTGGSTSRAHGALMRMPSSKAAILDPDFNEVGIGVVRKGPYALYVTEILIESNGGNGGTPGNPPEEPNPQPEPQPEPVTDPEPPAPPVEPEPPSTPPIAGLSQEEQLMLQLINQERAKVGLPAYQVDMRLMEVARAKAKDMVDKNYFSHYSPTFGDPVQMIKNAGISVRMGQENIAMAGNVAAAHAALMRSDAHRRAILNKYYTHVGVGIAPMNYGIKVSQLFIVP